jgi:hypothetical protein
MNKTEIEVTGATVPFNKYEENGVTYFEFDSSLCEPPGPMVNAMSGLKLIDSPDKKLVMINMKKPMGLLPKIEEDFTYTDEALDDGKVKLIFSLKSDTATNTDFSDDKCHG